MTNGSKKTKYAKPVRASVLACIPALSIGAANAEDLTAGVVMEKMDGGERYTYVAGIVEGLAHARYMMDNRDTAGRSCIYRWFFKADGTLDLIYEAFRRYPQLLPGQVVGTLANQECGGGD